MSASTFISVDTEILRESIKLAALGARTWNDPVVGDEETLDLGGAITNDDVKRTIDPHKSFRLLPDDQ